LAKLNKLAEREGVASFLELDLEMYAGGHKQKPGSPSAGSPRNMRSPKSGKSPLHSAHGGRKKTTTSRF